MKEITFSDMRAIIKAHTKALRRAALIVGLLILSLRLFQSPLYVSEALFIDAKSGQLGESEIFKKMGLKALGLTHYEGHAFSAFQSHKILARAAAACGYQVDLPQEGYIKRAINNIKSELGYRLPEYDGFAFRDVNYFGDSSLSLTLHFLKGGRYIVRDEAGITLSLGKLGEVCDLGSLSFRLTRLPKKCPKRLQLLLKPQLPIIDAVKNHLRLSPVKEDTQLIRCAFKDRDRERARDFLAALFNAYESELRLENRKKSEADLDFLKQRRDELMASLQGGLSHYVNYLTKGIEEGGYFYAEKEIKARHLERMSLEKQLLDITSERFQLDGPITALTLPPSPFAQKIENLILQKLTLEKRLEGLKQELTPPPLFHQFKKEAITAGLDLQGAENLFSHYQNYRDQLQSQLFNVERLLDAFSFQKAHALFGSDKWIDEGLHLERAASDERHFSDKERQRHLDQAVSLSHLVQGEIAEKKRSLRDQLSLTENKIAQLQKALIDQIEKEVAICSRHLHQTIAQRQKHLDQEEKRVRSQLARIKDEIALLPRKWQGEKQLQWHADLNQTMMANLTKLIEGKRVDDHLRRTESRPFDPPILPIMPQAPFLLFYTLLGLMLGFFARFTALLLREIHQV